MYMSIEARVPSPQEISIATQTKLPQLGRNELLLRDHQTLALDMIVVGVADYLIRENQPWPYTGHLVGQGNIDSGPETPFQAFTTIFNLDRLAKHLNSTGKTSGLQRLIHQTKTLTNVLNEGKVPDKDRTRIEGMIASNTFALE